MPDRDVTPALEIRLFGPPEARVNGAPLDVDTRKALAILAILATDARAYARDELAALLWPESDDAGARGALRRTLSVMRAAIDESVLRIDRPCGAPAPRGRQLHGRARRRRGSRRWPLPRRLHAT